MKRIEEFLSYLSDLDVKLWVHGDRLRCDAPKEMLTPSLHEELRERKTEIIKFFHKANLNSNSTLEQIRPIPREGDLPLSFGQQRLWFLDKLEGASPTYNEFFALKINGLLQINYLEQSFTEIVRRHEVLRTTFAIQNESPVQAIAPALTIQVPVVDLQGLPEVEQPARIQQLVSEEQKRPFDLSNGPLLRFTLLKLGKESHVLLLTMHHIVCDGWSMGIFVREFTALYESLCKGGPSPLPELFVQYADFAHWQRQWLSGDVLETQLNYWQKQLAGAPPLLELPTDRPRPPKQTFRGSSLRFQFNPDLMEQLKLLSQKSGATLYMTVLSAYVILLSRYSSQEDIVVGSPIANRNRGEIESLMGFFVNTLVLRINLQGNPSFSELLQRVRQVALDAYAHQDVPFEQLVDKLQPERSLSYSPLSQVAFAFQNTPMDKLELSGLTLAPLEIKKVTARNDLNLSIEETESGFIGVWEYNIDLFDVETITRMAEHLQNLLEGIVTNPQQPIFELPLLSKAERHQLLVEWNNTQVDYPQDKCIHQLFEAQVEQTPDAVAVVFQDQHLTYRQLNCRANQLANHLQSLGVGPEVVVGICVEPSLEMVVGLLGILKAGGAYVPLNPTYPFERLSFLLEDVQPPVLLTQEHLLDELPSHWAQVVSLDSDWEVIAQESEENLLNGATANNLAYVIYTSGSTGKPKGVLIAHQGLCNLAQAQISTFDVQSDSRVLQFASFSFDASVSEIFMALCSGAMLCLGTKQELMPGSDLIHLLQKQAITHVTLPPSALAVLPAEELPALQTIIVAGEACGSDLVAQWSAERRFFNAYGPTESTVCATIAECASGNSQSSIGRPIANTQVYILDQYLQPVPINVRGELHIGSVGLARGYLNRPDVTEAKFIPNPFSNEPEARLYKTGDRARYLPDGNIEFLGRVDYQVKIRGYRIEPGEIEALLAQHPNVREAVVIDREDHLGYKHLIAYIVEKSKRPDNLAQSYRGYLKELLPEYMVPSDFIFLESLPLTPNAKVDRRALPTPEQARHELKSDFVPPRDTLELQLAQIWEEVLNVRRVGIKDNFFDIGGHSLLAIRLMSKIQQQFEKDLPLTTLFSASTIEQLASVLGSSPDSLPWSPLVKIQPSGSKRPFFFMPGGGGTVLYLYHLARHLGLDQPFYGLQARGIDGEQPAHTQIEEIAAYNIEALRTIQPQGPYLLGGHSFGSFVAFEMTRQLLEQGQKVALLALMDTPAPIPGYNPLKDDVDDATYLVGLARNIERFTGNNLSISYEDLQQLNGEEQLNYVLERLKIVNIFPESAKLKQLRGFLQVFKSNDLSISHYLPQSVHPDQITVFRAEENQDFGDKPTMGWDKLSSLPIETYLVPGDHITMMVEPHVQVLAEQLRTCLDRVQTDG